jgi:glycosyltransferase involved in cell wall biosynthesis
MPQPTPGRLLLVAAEFPPRGGGGVIRVTKLVKYLARLGWSITVVCSDEPVGATEDPTLLAEIPDHVRVARIRGPLRGPGATARTAVESARSHRGGGRLWDSARSAARAFALPDRWIGWSLRVGRLSATDVGAPDVIVSSGPPHSAHLAARRLARRFGVPFVIDLRDDWAGNPLFASRAPWRDPIDDRIERRTVRRAAGIVVVSESSKELYARRYPSIARRIHVIPNGFDPEDLPAGIGEHRPPGPGEPVRFLHAGSLRYRQRDPGPLLEAFGRSARADSTLVLHLLGSVSPTNEARARAAIPAASLSLDGFVSHDEALRRMAAADVLVVISSVSEAGGGTLTGKIFECLAVRRPILLISPPGPAADLVKTADAGLVADPGDGEGLAGAIVRSAALARAGGVAGARPEVLARYDRSVQAASWSRLLLEAVGR